MAEQKRYVLVGTGGRSTMFIDAICGDYRASSSLAGLCDLSSKRLAYHNQRIQEQHGLAPVPVYLADDFDRMIEETRPDGVIVSTIDSEHHTYIIRAMELGCDVISEKPMTTDATKARAIFDAIDRTGRQLRVTFNLRYGPLFSKVHELIRDGVIGQPTMVNLDWVLNTSHGADYFRRWHAEKDKSGGLLVHKATHHFDVVNYWLGSYPKTVSAMGGLAFYGQAAAEARGQRYNYERYTGMPEAQDDPFALDLTADETMRGLYLDAEAETGYLRDRNVFGSHVTIDDTMAVTARYRNGVILHYSLLAYCPWEGFAAAVTGTQGRIEVHQKLSPGLAAEQAKGGPNEKMLRVCPLFGQPYDVKLPEGKGGHGGADGMMLDQLFGTGETPDHRAATHIDGAASLLLGVAANQSISRGEFVQIDQLLPLPERV